jgi:hypothetical protein
MLPVDLRLLARAQFFPESSHIFEQVVGFRWRLRRPNLTAEK